LKNIPPSTTTNPRTSTLLAPGQGLTGERDLFEAVERELETSTKKHRLFWPAANEFAERLSKINGSKTRNDNAPMSLTCNSSLQKNSSMNSGAYLRQQAEILIAMSQATFDLGVAGRLRIMASEFQNRAAEQEAEHG
jgi:hypothetical protein